MKKLLTSIVFLSLLLSAVICINIPTQAEEQKQVLRYGKSTITEPDVAYAYNILEQELTKPIPPEAIEFSADDGLSEAEMKKAFTLFVSDHPECFWITISYNFSQSNGNITRIRPNYSFTGQELTSAKAELENAVSGILAQMPDTNNYDKALYLHDTLAKIVQYEQVGEHQSAYGALVCGKAVCAGYAAAYQLLLQRAGIDAWTVGGYGQHPGDAQKIAHAWNLVWMDENTCVYTDVTWNDSDDELFHYYFGLSKEEISVDHEITEDIYPLPDCSHDDQSYFDFNDRTVNDLSTVGELALLFSSPEGGARKGVFLYEGNDIDAFAGMIEENMNELYLELGCTDGEYSTSLFAVGNEIHMTVSGKFNEDVYTVRFAPSDTLKNYSGTDRHYVTKGNPIEPVSFFTVAGYFLPEDYSVNSMYGITITRVSSKQLTVSGTPTTDLIISLPPPSVMQREEAPHAVFTWTAHDEGVLSSVEDGMKYSFDMATWVDITSSESITVSDLSDGKVKIYILKSGDGQTTLDSTIQIISDISPIQPPKPSETEFPHYTEKAETAESEKPLQTPSRTETAEHPNNEKPAEESTDIINSPTQAVDEDEFDFSYGCQMTSGISALLCAASLLGIGMITKKKEQ